MARRRKDFARQQADRQRQWMIEHGADLQGYINRYGSKDDPNHYGDGGELIYAADLAALREWEAKAR